MKVNALQAIEALIKRPGPRNARSLLDFVEKALSKVDEIDFSDPRVSREEYVTMLYSYRCECKLRLAVAELKAELDPKSRVDGSPVLMKCLYLMLPIESQIKL